jgi:hypothetical protein
MIRLIGLGVGLDFYFGVRRNRFLAQVIGWSIFTLAGIFHLFSYLIEDTSEFLWLKEIFFLLFAICTSVGVFLLAISIMVYFTTARKKFVILASCALASISILIYLIFNVNLAVDFSLYSSYIIVAGIYMHGVVEKENFKQEVGASIKWFYAICIVGLIQVVILVFLATQGSTLGLFGTHTQDDFQLFVNNTLSIGLLALTVVLFIHLETSRSERYNYRLKDKYSHDLGNLVQVIVSGMQFLEAKQIAEIEKKETITLINDKCEEVAELIHEIRNL